MRRNILIVIGITAILSGVIYFGLNAPCVGTSCSDKLSNATMQTKNISIQSISPDKFFRRLDESRIVLIDIRTAEEYMEGHIENSTQIDFYQTTSFRDKFEKMDKTMKYLIYCRTGNRSGQTLALMKSMGFENVADLDGGFVAWTRAGYTLVK